MFLKLVLPASRGGRIARRKLRVDPLLLNGAVVARLPVIRAVEKVGVVISVVRPIKLFCSAGLFVVKTHSVLLVGAWALLRFRQKF